MVNVGVLRKVVKDSEWPLDLVRYTLGPFLEDGS